MKIQQWMSALATVTVAFMPLDVPAAPHHASAPFYEDGKTVEVQGTVTKFLIRNPHSFLYFEMTDDKGQKVEWQVELGAAASLTRTGWTSDTLRPGMVIKAIGRPSRAEGSYGMCCARITLPDGSPVVAGGRVTEEPQPPR